MGGRYLIILSMDNDLPASRFGITVSRKTGNAVIRNRVKRRIRELQRLNRDSIVPGKDIVVIATREASRATFEKMEIEYTDLIRRAGLDRRSSGK
jgi:ribonuclease P protein component